MNFIQKCIDVWDSPQKEVARWKSERKCKVIGWGMMYAPEELIAAAGCLPVYLHGEHCTVSEGNRQLQNYFCPPIRMMTNSALKGDFSVADALLFVGTCDEMEHTANLLGSQSETQPTYLLHIPFALYQSVCQEKVRKELAKLKSGLEAISGHRITTEDLCKTIRIGNQTRSLLRGLYALRTERPGILSNVEMRAIVGASMFMPKDVYNQGLASLLVDLEQKPDKPYKARVMLAGGICDDLGDVVLSSLDEVGLAVVEDDLFIGGHYFQSDIDESCDPFEAIAKFFWEGTPTPCKLQKADRCYAENIVTKAKASQAAGIINCEWKFCEFQSYARPYLKDVFENADIPFLKIEIAEETMAKESIRIRCEAFAEMIGREEN